jgi:hypothetical protein
MFPYKNTRNTPTIFAFPSAIGKNMIFGRKIVIFYTKYPKNLRASLRSAQFFSGHYACKNKQMQLQSHATFKFAISDVIDRTPQKMRAKH